MAGSSELSDALNPYFCQQGQNPQANVSPNYDQHTWAPVPLSGDVPQQSTVLPLTPHRSELANAIGPAVISPSGTARSIAQKQSHQPVADPLQLLKGLIQSISTYKAAVEQEKKRRLTWEQEQEAKHLTRQAELENRVAELQRELEALKEIHAVSHTHSIASSESIDLSSSTEKQTLQTLKESVMLFEPKQDVPDQPEFVEGSSASASNLKKRTRSGSPNDSSEQEPMKLRTHRLSRPQTIQAAMRNHILRRMDLDHDKELPDSTDETVRLPPTHPIRFVWDQTTKKSAHNARMKARIVADMIANKDLYPLVPAQEFTKGKLESVFEQAYTTLRQKYASQKGLKAKSKDRAEIKSRKARRLSRKKIKLTNRIGTRKNLDKYSHAAFDAAFQLDCMSSEESSEGEDAVADGAEGDNSPTPNSLRIRCLAWRSKRLQELFRIIDEHEQLNRDMKPKRGVGRKDRHVGPPKDGNPPPPKGIPHWMVGKKWLRQASAVNQQIASLVNPNDETTVQAFCILGAESSDEEQTAIEQDFAQISVSSLPMGGPLVSPINADGTFHHAQYMYAQHAAWADTMTGYVDLSHFTSPVLQTYPPPGVPHSS